MDRPGIIEIIARGVCLRRGHVLLCRNRKATLSYLPGGHIEFGESAAAALARELAEEAGLAVRVGRFLGACEHAFTQKGRPHAEVNLLFLFQAPGLTFPAPPPAREKHLEFFWAPLARLRAARMEPAVLIRRLPRWIHGGPTSGTGAGWCGMPHP